MTRSDAALERNPDAVSSLVRPESNDQIAGLHPQHAAPAPETKVAPLQPTVSSQRSKRAALIIANSDYRYVPLLKNPVNDARALATALRSTGFQSVTVKTDLTREQMIAALREFATLADQSDWATVYYAGHGIEFGGVNYLVPVDAQLRFDRDIALETVELDKVISAIDSARALRLVVLDACRENPFLNRMRRSGTARSIGRGLAPVEPVAGTMIVYAAKAGEIAFDGDDANSPFAAALLKRMQTPKLEIRRLFDLVRDDVMAATRNRQQPFSYGSLPGSQDFYLVAQ